MTNTIQSKLRQIKYMPVFHSRGNKHFQVHPKTSDLSKVALVPEVIYSICKYIPEIWNPLQRKKM